MVEGVGSWLASVEVGWWHPFGVAVGVFWVVQPPGCNSRCWGPQPRVSLYTRLTRNVVTSAFAAVATRPS